MVKIQVSFPEPQLSGRQSLRKMGEYHTHEIVLLEKAYLIKLPKKSQ